MSNLQKKINLICQELGWKPRVQANDSYLIIICPLAEDSHFKGVLFAISENENRLMMSASYRLTIAPEMNTAIYEEISRINFGLLAGCLEFDSEHGEIRYRDGLFFPDLDADTELLRAFIATTLRDAITYHSEVETVISS